MKKHTLINSEIYEEGIKGYSKMWGDPVMIIGEQVIMLDDGRIIEQYVYNMIGQPSQNGMPYVALKANIGLID